MIRHALYPSIFLLLLATQAFSDFNPWENDYSHPIWLSGVLLATIAIITQPSRQLSVFFSGALAFWVYNLTMFDFSHALSLSALQTLEPFIGLQILKMVIKQNQSGDVRFELNMNQLSEFTGYSLILLVGISGIGSLIVSQSSDQSWLYSYEYWASASVRGAATFIPLGYALIWFFAKYPLLHFFQQFTAFIAAILFSSLFYLAIENGYDSFVLLALLSLTALSLAGPIASGLTYFASAYIYSNQVMLPISVGEYESLDPIISLFALSCALIFVMHLFSDKFYRKDWIIRYQDHIEVITSKKFLAWIDSGQLRFEFQPIVHFQHGHIKLKSLEALIRLNIKPFGEIPVAAFIETFTQIIYQPDLHLKLLERFTEQIQSFEKLELKYISLNFSPDHLRQASIIEKLIEINHRSKTTLLIEILEQQDNFLKDPILKENMKQLIENGFLIALDDYGKEHSNLERLIEFPVNYLKIDKTLIIPLHQSKRHQALVSGTADICHLLGISVVAEGVENIETAHLLEQMGIVFHQGFHYAKSLPADKVIDFSQQTEKF